MDLVEVIPTSFDKSLRLRDNENVRSAVNYISR